MYVSPEELRRIVKDAQAVGGLTPELAGVVVKICDGLWGRYRFFRIDKDDFTQEVCLVVHIKVPTLDTTKNVFNYLTSVAINEARFMVRKEKTEARKIWRLRENKKPVNR